MECYKIIEELSSCRFSTTFLVTKKGDFTNKKLILKKIECKDESHANRAYHELLQQKLHQETMEEKVATKSFFIMWDKSICSQEAVQEASIFICIIRNYFETSLAFVADSFHMIKKPMEEQTIINYLSEIVELLEPFHNENIAHRSIQLSNIFKYGAENKLLLVDFGISSFLINRKRFSTLKDGDLVWLAPELRFEQKDKAGVCWLKVDIWCLGSILMSFLLTSFMDTLKDMKAFVLKTKIDECLLNYFWDKLEQMYSGNLLSLAKRMLSQYTEERPTLIELKEYLSKMSCTEEPVLPDMREDFEPIENEDSFSDLLNYVSKYSEHSKCVIECLIKLNKLLVTTPDIEVPVDSQSFIWELLCQNLDNAQLLTEGLHLIEKLTSISNDHLQNIFSESTIDAILTIMECQLKETVFLTVIYSFLMIILTSESANNYFNTKGGMTTLLNRLPKDLTDDTTVSSAAMTLSNLIVNPSNAKAALEYGIIKILYENLQFHFNYQGAVAELLAVFIPLATYESAIFQFNQCQLLTLFVNIMNTYCSNDAIVKNCCIILRDVLNSISIYDDGILELTETRAVSAMVGVLYSNTESIDVVIECCTTLAALCNMSSETDRMKFVLKWKHH
ncbi:uncharacterized protein LOC106870894 isoform X2 [Octopus bimaculoides]|uniref:uncharacterized protein LOC106870894 isoform X2 n=1 Tax=Octopus bimaculoides TaxID=37653 RepID=UPI0022E5F938|nr:uncharacterized protein LOC106870894 isoform X2 [Octopus bimaculoides]